VTRPVLRTTLHILVAFTVLLAAVSVSGAPSRLKVSIDAGSEVVEFAGQDYLITTTHDIVVSFVLDSGEVTGMVEPAQVGTQPYVTITVVGNPDETIFSGKVVGPTPFESVHPHETGHIDN